MPPELLTTRELADRLDVQYGDILEWTRDGIIPAIRTGRAYFYNLASVVEAIRERRAAIEAEAREAVPC